MVRRWRLFGDFLRGAFSASHVHHVSDLHPKFALRPHHVWKYGSHPISTGFTSWQHYCMALDYWASAKVCGAEQQRTPPIFGRAAITLGIGPHSSLIFICVHCFVSHGIVAYCICVVYLAAFGHSKWIIIIMQHGICIHLGENVWSAGTYVVE